MIDYFILLIHFNGIQDLDAFTLSSFGDQKIKENTKRKKQTDKIGARTLS